jgi:hypothetical protein
LGLAASIHAQKIGRGNTYRVLWRADGRQRSLTFENLPSAERFKTLLEDHGPEEALRVIELGKHVPTVTEWLNTHIDNLTGVQPATLARYRTYVRRDVEPVFGSLPISAVTETTITRWVKQLGGSGKTIANKHLQTLLTATTAARVKTVLVGDPHQLSPVLARGGMLEQLCDELPWTQRLSEVWRMRDPKERQASLALRSGHGNRLRHAIGWYRTHDRLHTGDPVAMASDALDGYLTDRNAGKDSLLICDTWELADALNRRLHDTLTTQGPAAKAAREQEVRVGDLAVSRRNDATITVRPGIGHRGGDGVDQVRNGNRWRVVGVEADTNRVAAERLTDNARVVFEGDYLREHLTLGYAVTVHSAQGVTTNTAHAVIADSATRAMAYVALSRGRDTNQAYVYTRDTAEAEHDHSQPIADGELHHLRRGTKYSAAHHLRTIVGNEDRPRTMHVEAQQTDRGLLSDTICRLLDRHDRRLISRAAVRGAALRRGG